MLETYSFYQDRSSKKHAYFFIFQVMDQRIKKACVLYILKIYIPEWWIKERKNMCLRSADEV